ncbi:hypothetical protein HPB47_001572, partial [Ixodes persulcatus]
MDFLCEYGAVIDLGANRLTLRKPAPPPEEPKATSSAEEEDLSARELSHCQAAGGGKRIQHPWCWALGFVLSVLFTLFVLTLLLVFLFGSATEVGRGVAAVCRSPSCLRYSHWLRESVSRSKRPCDDFYEHVCDGWIIKNTHTVQVEQHRRFQEDVIKSIRNVTWTGDRRDAAGMLASQNRAHLIQAPTRAPLAAN